MSIPTATEITRSIAQIQRDINALDKAMLLKMQELYELQRASANLHMERHIARGRPHCPECGKEETPHGCATTDCKRYVFPF